MEPHRFLRRKAASKYLHEVHGVVRAPSTLAKYAVIGGGPVFQRLGRDPVYTPVNLDNWVASKLSGPMRSTSDTPTADKTSSNDPEADTYGSAKHQRGAVDPLGKITS
jgi:hypothetical protein